MAKFMKIPVVVDARQVVTPEAVLTAHGIRVRAEPGDWVVVDPSSGDTWPVKAGIFEATYVPVEEDA